MTRTDKRNVRILMKDGMPISIPVEMIDKIKIPGIEVNNRFNRLFIDVNGSEGDLDKAINKALKKLTI